MFKLKNLVATVLCSAFMLVGCNAGGDSAPVITLARTSVELDVGDDYVIEVSVDPQGTALTFTTSDNTIASVDTSGVVRALKVGEATVTISAKSAASKQLKVTVSEAKQPDPAAELEKYKQTILEYIRGIDAAQFKTESANAQQLLDKAVTDVQAAKTQDEVSQISSKLTSDLRVIRLKVKKADANAEVDAVDKTEYVDDDQAALTKLIADTKAAIEAATKDSEVSTAMETFREELGKLHKKTA